MTSFLRHMSLLFLLLMAVPALAQDSAKDERCRIEAGRLVCDPVERPKLDPKEGDRDFFAGQGGSLRPARLFAGPDLYPPQDYRGYGILAFASRATEFDRNRHLMICAAYVASLPDSAALEVPTEDQFVTIWPVETGEAALEITALPREDACGAAIDAYDLDAAHAAITAAEKAGFEATGLGPYLLAWSPPEGIGRDDVFVLELDLSNVRGYDQALAMMREWNRDIETDFEILAEGFTLDRLRVVIRRWADTYGEGFLKLLRAG